MNTSASPSRPPEIMYGICSKTSVVLAAPIHPSTIRIAPRPTSSPPTTSRVRAGPAPPGRVPTLRTAVASCQWWDATSSSSSTASGVVVVMGLLSGAAEIGGGYFVGDVLGASDAGDATADHDGGLVGDGEGGAGELLDEEDRDPLGRQLADEVVQPGDDQRGEAHRDLVEQEQQ